MICEVNTLDSRDLDMMLLEMEMLESADDAFLESGIFDFVNAFQVTIEKIINTMKDYVNRLKIDIETMQGQMKYKERLKLMKEQLQAGKIKGRVMCVDMQKIVQTFARYTNAYQRELDRILAMKCNSYKDLEKLDARIAEFYDELDAMDAEIENIQKHPLYMKPEDAVRFLESGNTYSQATYKQYFKLMDSIKKFESTAERKLTNKELTEETSLQYFKKSQGLLSRASNRISRSMRNCIMTVCLFKF